MKHRITALAVAASLALGFGMASSASAATAGGQARDLTASQQQTSIVQQAQFWDDRGRDREDRRDWRERRGDRDWHDRRGDRDWRDRRDRRHYHRPPPPPRSGIYFEFGPRYAPPPRYYAPPRQVYRLPASHVRWCENQYRSYRAWDNTFQPYNGPRRQCASPYI